MSEIGGNIRPEDLAAKDHAVTGELGKVKTCVADCFADGEKGGLPVFNVSKDEFHQNMRHGRKRVRFKNGTSASKYMAGSMYKQAFHISHDGYTRKIK